MAARDAAILALLYGSGLRRAEAVGLEVADYDREGGTLKVRGKGNKERLAHLGDASQAALEAWLVVRGFASGPLFVAINKGGRLIYGRGMSGQAMLYIARRRTIQASVAAFAPRPARTFIGDLLDAGRRSQHRPAARRPCPDPDHGALRPPRRGHQEARGQAPPRAVPRAYLSALNESRRPGCRDGNGTAALVGLSALICPGKASAACSAGVD